MKRIFILFLFTSIILQSCSPKIRTHLSNKTFKPLSKESDVFTIKEDEQTPENSIFIGELEIGDSGFSTHCGYNEVLDHAKETARQSGANLIHLTELKSPNSASTCYRIKAKLYRNLNSDALAQIVEKRALDNTSRLSPNADYAIVYFYRPKNPTGYLIGYKVKIDDKTVIGRVRNGEKFEFKTSDFGKHEFWAKTESKTSIIIDIEKGQEYFVRCAIDMGIAVGRPEMYVIENEIGISEYELLKEKKKK